MPCCTTTRLEAGEYHAFSQTRQQKWSRQLQPGKLEFSNQQLLKSLVRNKIVNHIMSNGLFADSSWGIVPRWLSTSQSLVELAEWTEIWEKGGPSQYSKYWLSKAFDWAPHRRLLSKFEAYGIFGKVTDRIEHFPFWASLFFSFFSDIYLIFQGCNTIFHGNWPKIAKFLAFS